MKEILMNPTVLAYAVFVLAAALAGLWIAREARIKTDRVREETRCLD